MIKLDSYKGKKLGVLGLGKSGLSIVHSLIKTNLNYICYDDNIEACDQAKKQTPEINLVTLSDPRWYSLDILVCSPGINIVKHPLYTALNNTQILCDIELLYQEQHNKATFLGITGTNGKSTTTSLTAHILQYCKLQAEAGGNIGLPALSLSQDSTHYVLELSSYQLELIHQCKFKTAALLNVTPDHLDRHHTMENYTHTKMKLFANADNSSFGFINIDNPITYNEYKKIVTSYPGKLIGISTETIQAGALSLVKGILYDYAFTNQEFMLANRKYMLGKHNEENIIASYGLAKSLDLNSNDVINAILSYKGLAHRMEYVTTVNNTTIINDSKATNSDAAEKALSSYSNIYWIVGGLPKTDRITSLSPLFHKVKKAYLVGTSKYEFAKFMDLHNLPYVICENLAAATELSLKEALNDPEINTVLLSPACASWDEWPNFEVRGDHFKQYVLAELHKKTL
jgi:UDP-N-acetylmuramoylalanine--D-glutamate ligase